MLIVLVLISLIVIFFAVIAKNKTVYTNKDNHGKLLWRKGDYGELRVSHVLSQLPDGYHVFNDVYLESGGYSSQIDHVVISQFGIFVIETKNYSGAIYGNEDSKQWTQYLGGKEYKFLNPIKQNQSHLLAVKNTLRIAPSSIIPIVVFLGGTDLHCDTTSAVLHTKRLRDYILSHKTIAFTTDGVEHLSNRLSESMVVGPGREQNHIRSVKRNIINREMKIANRVCPRCNGNLVERRGKYGRFLGCSNYPYCKFTHQL